MKKILWFLKFGWAKQPDATDRNWRGLYAIIPRRGITLNEGRGPANLALYWWPHVFFYAAVRFRGTWRRVSFDWS